MKISWSLKFKIAIVVAFCGAFYKIPLGATIALLVMIALLVYSGFKDIKAEENNLLDAISDEATVRKIKKKYSLLRIFYTVILVIVLGYFFYFLYELRK